MRDLSAGAWRFRIRLVLGVSFLLAGVALQLLHSR